LRDLKIIKKLTTLNSDVESFY